MMLVHMARNPLFEWIMQALQMGYSSHDHALYEDPSYRDRAAANWSDTARAIADNEPMRALSYISRHYGWLRQCVAEGQKRGPEQDAPLFADVNAPS